MLITFADTMTILNEKKVYDEAIERLEAAKEDYLSYYNKYQDQIASGADESSPDLISLGSAVRKAKREALNALNDAKDAKQNLLIAMDEAVAKSSNKKGKDKRKAAEKQRSINKAITEADNWYMKQRNDIDSYVLDTEADTKKIRDSVDDQKRMTILANYVKLYREILEKKEELRLLPISDPSVREERLQLKEDKSDLEDKLDTLEQKNPALAADFEEQRKKLNTKVSNNYKDERANAKLDQEDDLQTYIDQFKSLKQEYADKIVESNVALDQGETAKYKALKIDLNDLDDKANAILRKIKRIDQATYKTKSDEWIQNRTDAVADKTDKIGLKFVENEAPGLLSDLADWMEQYQSSVLTYEESEDESPEESTAKLRMDKFTSKINNAINTLKSYESQMNKRLQSKYNDIVSEWTSIKPGSTWRTTVTNSAENRKQLKKFMDGSTSPKELMDEAKNSDGSYKTLYYVTYQGKPVTGYTISKRKDEYDRTVQILNVQTTDSVKDLTDVLYTEDQDFANNYASAIYKYTGDDAGVATATNRKTIMLVKSGEPIGAIPNLDGSNSSSSYGYRSNGYSNGSYSNEPFEHVRLRYSRRQLSNSSIG